jgi:hypothetical protein
MITFYLDRLVLVTDEVFEVNYPYRHRFVLNDLRDIHVVRGAHDRLAVTMAGVAGALWLGLALGSPFLRTPAAWLAAVALVATPSVLGGACWRLRPPSQELRATYRGRPVQLLCTADARKFGQVKRALMRALEVSAGW